MKQNLHIYRFVFVMVGCLALFYAPYAFATEPQSFEELAKRVEVIKQKKLSLESDKKKQNSRGENSLPAPALPAIPNYGIADKALNSKEQTQSLFTGEYVSLSLEPESFNTVSKGSLIHAQLDFRLVSDTGYKAYVFASVTSPYIEGEKLKIPKSSKNLPVYFVGTLKKRTRSRVQISFQYLKVGEDIFGCGDRFSEDKGTKSDCSIATAISLTGETGLEGTLYSNAGKILATRFALGAGKGFLDSSVQSSNFSNPLSGQVIQQPLNDVRNALLKSGANGLGEVNKQIQKLMPQEYVDIPEQHFYIAITKDMKIWEKY